MTPFSAIERERISIITWVIILKFHIRKSCFLNRNIFSFVSSERFPLNFYESGLSMFNYGVRVSREWHVFIFNINVLQVVASIRGGGIVVPFHRFLRPNSITQVTEVFLPKTSNGISFLTTLGHFRYDIASAVDHTPSNGRAVVRFTLLLVWLSVDISNKVFYRQLLSIT